ncbi:hypothetical protein C2845_PM09G12760, partial [Panicum miliaceum]
GLALPASDCIRGLLYHWGIQFHHLNPNSITHIFIFIHFCEAFLGIEPHFDLFCYFFHLLPQPSSDKQVVVGRVGLQFKQGNGKEYIKYKTPTNHSGWRELWFYIGNHQPALAERTPWKAVQRPEWNETLTRSEMVQVTDLVLFISALKKMSVTGASVLLSMFKGRIQPL